MKDYAHFFGEPEHLRNSRELRMRLMLCADEMALRYGGQVYLCGSALRAPDPVDWDVRVILDNLAFDKQAIDEFWAREGVLRTEEQRRMNRLPFDVRIYPRRVWYGSDCMRLDVRMSPPAPTAPVAAEGEESGDAEASRRVIEEQKNNPEFHVTLGTLMFVRGDKDMALRAFLRAVELDPNSHAAWLNIGNVFYDRREYRRAAIYYRRAIVIKPDYAKAFTNLANTLAQLGVHDWALQFYDRSLKFAPEFAETHHNKANCLIHLKRFAEAEESLNRSVELEPCDERILNTIGNLRISQEREYAAGAAYQLAIEVNPKYAPLYTNLANVYASLGKNKDAIRNYEVGLILDPKNPGVRYNLALAYLRRGDYALGWKAYESRWGFCELNIKQRKFSQPQWRGEYLLYGKRILIHAEQGLGDTLQFCRYVPLVRERGGDVYFEVQHGLQRLAATVSGVKKVLTRGMPLPEFDVHCPLMSLPAVFKTTVATVPHNIPYVTAWDWQEREARQRWPQAGMRVGISWAGNPKYKKDKERSFSLLEFAALRDIDATFFSLQKGPAARQIEKYKDEFAVVDASSDAKDFAESAALIATLDLVIASDSSPAHLAGAMGKEVWLLLAYLPDWRWIDGESTPWYPNTRIFRQTSPGDWHGVFERVRVALRERVETYTLSISRGA